MKEVITQWNQSGCVERIIVDGNDVDYPEWLRQNPTLIVTEDADFYLERTLYTEEEYSERFYYLSPLEMDAKN